MHVVVPAGDAFEIHVLPGAVDRPVGIKIAEEAARRAVVTFINSEVAGPDAAAPVQPGEGDVVRAPGLDKGRVLCAIQVGQSVPVCYRTTDLAEVVVVEGHVQARLW